MEFETLRANNQFNNNYSKLLRHTNSHTEVFVNVTPKILLWYYITYISA